LFVCLLAFSSGLVYNWLERHRHPPIPDVPTPGSDSGTSASAGSGDCSRQLLPAVGVTHSGRPTRRGAESNVVDGRHPALQFPTRASVDSCYLEKEPPVSEEDGGNGTTWLTGLHRGLQGDGRASSPSGHSHRGNHDDDVQNHGSTTRVDSTLLWCLAQPFASK